MRKSALSDGVVGWLTGWLEIITRRITIFANDKHSQLMRQASVGHKIDRSGTDMLWIATQTKAGKITPSVILRLLDTYRRRWERRARPLWQNDR